MRKYIMFIIIVITLLIPFSAAARDNKGIITDPAKELKWNYFVDNLLRKIFKSSGIFGSQRLGT